MLPIGVEEAGTFTHVHRMAGPQNVPGVRFVARLQGALTNRH